MFGNLFFKLTTYKQDQEYVSLFEKYCNICFDKWMMIHVCCIIAVFLFLNQTVMLLSVPPTILV